MSDTRTTTQCNESFLEIFEGDEHLLTKDALDNQRVWVFGYGSILWKTGFEYASRRVGYITGYTRKFWQGNSTHRGTEDKPGRVATLAPAELGEEEDTLVWGIAYELVGETMVRNAMNHLYGRECKLGGYSMEQVQFYTQNCTCDPINTLLFLATPQSSDYLGPAPEFQLAEQIVDCEGPSGHNIEYVLMLSMYLKKFMPQGLDLHLSMLDMYISNMLLNSGLKVEDFVRISLYMPQTESYEDCSRCCCAMNNILTAMKEGGKGKNKFNRMISQKRVRYYSCNEMESCKGQSHTLL